VILVGSHTTTKTKQQMNNIGEKYHSVVLPEQKKRRTTMAINTMKGNKEDGEISDGEHFDNEKEDHTTKTYSVRNKGSFAMTRLNAQEGNWRDDGHTYTSSWPPPRRRTSIKNKQIRNHWAHMTPEQAQVYREALNNKNSGVGGAITMRCINALVSCKFPIEDKIRTNQIIEICKRLWILQKGRCMLTGRPMVAEPEEIERTPKSGVTVVCLRKPEYGIEWVEGNIGLVCSNSKPLIMRMGLLEGVKAAADVVRFSEFKSSRHFRDQNELYDTWDIQQSLQNHEKRWNDAMIGDESSLVSRFTSNHQVLDRDALAAANKDDPRIANMAKHCVELCKIQRGRCALSGVRFSMCTNKKERPYCMTVDRIDCTKPHEKGNIWLATWGMNKARQNMTVNEFDVFCKDVVQYHTVPI
jgi:hypothetical protein